MTSRKGSAPVAEFSRTTASDAETIGLQRASKTAVFAVGRPPGKMGRLTNPFAGTVAVTLPERGKPAGLDVFAAEAKRVARFYDEATDTAVYLVGRAAHAKRSGDSLLKLCAGAVSSNPSALRDLLGAFVVLVDDRRAGRVLFASDVMGLLPWFTGQFDGRLVAGTDVLGICDAGLSRGEVDYDAVANWLCYSFVVTGGSVVRDYRRLKAGTVATFASDGRSTEEACYAPVKFVRNVVSPEALTDGLHERVRGAVETLTRGIDEVNLPLSGGYDSRLLCAIASRQSAFRFHATVVGTAPEELVNSRRVAGLLGLRLEELTCPRSKVDLFDDPLFFLAEGFPLARNLTSAVARMRPGLPLLSGFVGDGLMRGSMTKEGAAFQAKDDAADTFGDEWLGGELHKQTHLLTNRLHLLRDHIGPRAHERSIASMTAAVRDARPSGRPIAYTSLFIRQRLYFANIFLSHLEVADALLPFATWDLLSYNASHAGSFAGDTYDHLFRRIYPKLTGIPHSLRIAETTSPGRSQSCSDDARPTRHLRRWGSELLRDLPRLLADETAINAKKLLRRLPSALLLDGHHANEIGYLHRIHAFETRLAQASVRIDWSKI